MTALPVSVSAQRLVAYVHALLSVTNAEWRIRWRMNSTMILVVLFAALAILLTPGVEAPYAVMTVTAHRLAMTADTMLIAATSLLALLLMPAQFLSLSLGFRRDIQAGMAPLHLTAALPSSVLNLGRIVFRVTGLCTDAVLILALLSLAVLIRHQVLPGMTALAVSMLILLPSGMAAFMIGIVIDSLSGNVSVRVGIALLVWCVMMLMSLLGGIDVIGYGLLSFNLAGDSGPVPVSLGFSPAAGLPVLAWDTLLLPTAWFAQRWTLLLFFSAIVGMLGVLVRRPRNAPVAARQPVVAAANRDIAAPVPPLLETRPISLHGTLALIARRLMLRRKMPVVALALIALLPALGAPRNLAAAAVLLLPLVFFNARVPDAAVTNMVLLPSLWRPTPNLMALTVLVCLMTAMLLPCLLVLHWLQVLQMALACMLAASWFIFCHHILRRPQLAQAVLITAWYVFAVNSPPPAFDLIGQSAGNPMLAAILALLGLIVVGMIGVADWRQKR